MIKFEWLHVVLVGVLLLFGGGAYVTYFQQEETIATLDQKIEAAQDRQAEGETLQQKVSTLQQRAKKIRQRGRVHYKKLPETMSTPRMVGYLTRLTKSGFKAFNLGAAKQRAEEGYQVYAVTAEGRAFFSSLYHFIWVLENNRPFYRIRNLQLSMLDERTTDEETGRTSMDVLVSFRMDVEALYGVDGGHSGTDTDRMRDERRLPRARTAPHPPVPARVLPTAEPAGNPFYPLVFQQIPPNEHGRLNVESAQFLSIVGGEAIFQTEAGIERVEEGDSVYLGRIVEVNSSEGRVVARLNKGGIVERVERTLAPSETPSEQGGP